LIFLMLKRDRRAGLSLAYPGREHLLAERLQPRIATQQPRRGVRNRGSFRYPTITPYGVTPSCAKNASLPALGLV
jgi:hypothetical protein